MSESSVQHHLNTEAGSAVYSPLVLKLYDWWVLGISNRFAWQCPTRTVLLPFYREHIGKRHLDVGVGTGFYLKHVELSPLHEIALLDINENSLRAASLRIRRPKVKLIKENVMRPLPRPAEEGYDSISLFYLLHCLPGTMDDKEIAVTGLKHYLKSDGVFYGATILGDEANHTTLGRRLMKIYNRKGVFGNSSDSIHGLQEMLGRQFRSVQVRRHNQVALFVARDPLTRDPQPRRLRGNRRAALEPVGRSPIALLHRVEAL
ncbi:MAG TPA: class I SAM-dependent methyltransferase [Candidatus Baltobacteraceae bacterium]|jgi:SAM-dependent methyltransferase|nr:class I SAM-dependent methyltransferase [Candidatus Baltobacteraceae bacterium]